MNSEIENKLWSTYYGDTSFEAANDIVIDNDLNNIYVVGYADSTVSLLPNVIGGAYNSITGKGLLLKFSSSFQRLWATTIGNNTTNCYIRSVDVDQSNNLYIGGFITGATLPSANNSLKGLTDGFVIKFKASDNSIDWSSYIGGDSTDVAISVAASKLDNSLYITGTTVYPSHFPFTMEHSTDYIDSTYNGGDRDIYIAKLNKTSGTILWSTLFGSNDTDFGANIVQASNHNVFLTGESYGSGSSIHWSHPLNGLFRDTTNAALLNQALILGFSADNKLFWSTFLGGDEMDAGFSLRTNNTGSELFVLGNTSSSPQLHFPLADGNGIPYFQDTLGNPNFNATSFIARFDIASLGLSIAADNKLEVSDVAIFPSPTISELNIVVNCTEKENAVFCIYNINGQVVSEQKTEVNKGIQKYKLSTINLKDGLYFFRIIGENKLNYCSKFIKQ